MTISRLPQGAKYESFLKVLSPAYAGFSSLPCKVLDRCGLQLACLYSMASGCQLVNSVRTLVAKSRRRAGHSRKSTCSIGVEDAAASLVGLLVAHEVGPGLVGGNPALLSELLCMEGQRALLAGLAPDLCELHKMIPCHSCSPDATYSRADKTCRGPACPAC